MLNLPYTIILWIFFILVFICLFFSGEPGMLIGEIINSDPTKDYIGYVDEKATESKILHDVFKKGDKAFMSGQLQSWLKIIKYLTRLNTTFILWYQILMISVMYPLINLD